MWRLVVTTSVLFYLLVTLVMAAPIYHSSRGPRYTVSKPAQPYLEVHNATYHGAGPREEARAMCSVRTHEVNATANATVTRRLHGVVTSSRATAGGARDELRAHSRGQRNRQCHHHFRTHKVETTVTRRLHAIVTSRELHNAIQRLEVIIYGQMQQLWQSLDAMRGQLTNGARASYPDRRSMTFRYKPAAL